MSDVICEGKENAISENEYGKVRFVAAGKNGRLLKLKRLVIWPFQNVGRSNRYYHAIQEMKQENAYDLVISVQRPIEGSVACARVGDFVLYELDSITNNGDNLYGIKHLLRYRAANLERYIYKRADHIFHLSCHKDYYAQKKYRKYDSKSTFTDIPHLIGQECSVQSGEITKPTDALCITYLGSLSNPRNTPDYSLELFSAVAKDKKIVCNFYSRGCEEALNKAKEQYPDVFFANGYVSQEQLPAVRQKADVFLSIGFAHTGTVTSIPSKIFEYMCTGKPIIHIIGGKNDTAVPYLQEYGNALLLDPAESMDINREKTITFIKENCGRLVDVQQLRDIFPMNTPEYTVDLFVKMTERRKMQNA